MIDSLDEIPEGEFASDADSLSHPILKQTVRELKDYFAGRLKEFTVPIDLQIGTEFQREVWAELRRIPYGKTISYGQQAKNIGRPNAMRAVGGANGRNPLVIVIPCHRVLSSAGKLHGFSSGLDLKRRLLAVEGLDIRK
ncbi:MAG: methylated-DNA--[protein]-cysteine S-methyltransferase [Proteobacteria bacterium]|nr:MAG: methylated-DNA--[protein]-cysteine S-methyltransferase [Pseudomonadota bacterium]